MRFQIHEYQRKTYSASSVLYIQSSPKLFLPLAKFDLNFYSSSKFFLDWKWHRRLSEDNKLTANHFVTTFAVCFGLLSCWNVHWCPRPSFSADCLMLLLQILLYCSIFMVPFTVITFPGPLAEKHLQSIRFSPPCLTVGMVFLELKASPFLRQMKDVSLWPNNSIFVSPLSLSSWPAQVSLLASDHVLWDFA